MEGKNDPPPNSESVETDTIRLIVKVKNSTKFTERIKESAIEYNIQSISNLNEKSVLLSFSSVQDCRRCENVLLRRMGCFQIIREEEGLISVIIVAQGDLSSEDVEAAILKTTGETPMKVVIKKLHIANKTKAFVQITSSALMKLRAENESHIMIGNTSCHYSYICRWMLPFFDRDRENPLISSSHFD